MILFYFNVQKNIEGIIVVSRKVIYVRENCVSSTIYRTIFLYVIFSLLNMYTRILELFVYQQKFKDIACRDFHRIIEHQIDGFVLSKLCLKNLEFYKCTVYQQCYSNSIFAVISVGKIMFVPFTLIDFFSSIF